VERNRLLGILAAALAAAGLGCGELSIRTWITVVEDESSAFVTVGESDPFPFQNIEGGFQIDVVLDTSTLPDPIEGEITIHQLRLIGEGPPLVGTFCAYKQFDTFSGGPFSFDFFTGEAVTDVVIDARAQSTVLEAVNGGMPIALQQQLDLDLGGALDPAAFLGALSSGSSEGLFATSAVIEDSFELIPGFPPANFVIDLALTNGPQPPVLRESTLGYCANWLWRQGNRFFQGVNPKSSLLRLQPSDDEALDPLVIDLFGLQSGVGNQKLRPGDPIGLTVTGSFARQFSTVDGSATELIGVFSSSPTVLPGDQPNRIPGAIDAGPDVVTPGYLECLFFPICWVVPTDIPEDFRIDAFDGEGNPQDLILTVPAGARYLIVAPRDNTYEDNTGLGFGVTIRTSTPFGFPAS
jgi:hypothetical protein